MSDAAPRATIRALEEGIVARLDEELSGLAIEALPDDPQAYRLRHQRGALLVGYRGAEYTEDLSLDEDVAQRRTLHFDVLVLARALHNHAGAYAHLEAVRAVLVGYAVEGFDQLVARGEQFLGHSDGVWTFSLTLAARSFADQVWDDELEDVLDEIYGRG